MSLTDILIKIVGAIFVLVGLALVLAGVGISIGLGAGLNPPLLGIVVGLLFVGIGIFIIRGGTITA